MIGAVWGFVVLVMQQSQPDPVLRPITPAAAVATIGVEVRRDGSRAAVDPSPGFGLSDLAVYDKDVATAFPPSGEAFPAESLWVARVARAGAWLVRGATSGRGPLFDPVLRATLAAAADSEVLAGRLFEEAIASRTPGRRSYVLAAAVTAFTRDERADSALARRLSVAERYLARLVALPRGGYTVPLDSVMLVDRVYGSATTVLATAARLGDTARVARDVGVVLSALQRYHGLERIRQFLSAFPCDAVMATMVSESDAAQRIAALARRIVTVVALTPSEMVEEVAPADRARFPHDIAQGVLNCLRRAALLGHPAPAVIAHAWLNTPDSLYEPAERTRSLADGTVRVVYFLHAGWHSGTSYYSVFPALARLQARIAPWGRVTVVTQAVGFVGTDLIEPADEVSAVRRMLREPADLSAEVAFWAGPKITTDDGDRRPGRSPMDTIYDQDVVTHYPALVVDGQGIVRGYFRLLTRRDEAVLDEALAYVHDEATGGRDALPRPASITARAAQMVMPAASP